VQAAHTFVTGAGEVGHLGHEVVRPTHDFVSCTPEFVGGVAKFVRRLPKSTSRIHKLLYFFTNNVGIIRPDGYP
jgi:hypothetical protein